jgi:chromosome segregation ATPase
MTSPPLLPSPTSSQFVRFASSLIHSHSNAFQQAISAALGSGNVAQMGAQIQALNTSKVALEADVARINNILATNTYTDADVDSKVSATSSAASGQVITETTRATAAEAVLTTAVNALRANVTTLQASVSSLANSAAANNTNVLGQVAALSAQTASIATQATTLAAASTTTASQLSALSMSSSANSSAMSTMIVQLQSRAASLESRTSTAESRLSSTEAALLATQTCAAAGMSAFMIVMYSLSFARASLA